MNALDTLYSSWMDSAPANKGYFKHRNQNRPAFKNH